MLITMLLNGCFDDRDSFFSGDFGIVNLSLLDWSCVGWIRSVTFTTDFGFSLLNNISIDDWFNYFGDTISVGFWDSFRGAIGFDDWCYWFFNDGNGFTWNRNSVGFDWNCFSFRWCDFLLLIQMERGAMISCVTKREGNNVHLLERRGHRLPWIRQSSAWPPLWQPQLLRCWK